MKLAERKIIQKNSPDLNCGDAQKLDWLTKTCRNLILSALQTMPNSLLIITEPDGKKTECGSPSSSPAANIEILHSDFWLRCVLYGHVGFAEAYLDGLWRTDSIQSVISWFIINIDDSAFLEGSPKKKALVNLLGMTNRLFHFVRPNSETGSRSNMSYHYDISNDMFAIFLDKSMTYSSARFSSPALTLEEAQLDKIDTMCKKLRLKNGDILLEIGSGWGSFAIHAATKYGCTVKTITISKQQFDYVKKKVQELRLSYQIEVELIDYRRVTGMYDKIVSIEMIEGVGDQYFETYFAKLASLLKKDGLLGIQMITCPDSRYEILKNNVDFIQKHIFPGSLLPSVYRVSEAVRTTSDLFLFELEDMGMSYVQTLDIWQSRFNSRLSDVHKLGFDDRFIRMWNYYFEYCRAAFSLRNITVAQAIFTRPNNPTLMDKSSKCSS